METLHLHRKKFVPCPDYKTDLVKKFEEEFENFQRDYYKSMVDKNKKAHIRARWCLTRMGKMFRDIRKEMLEHRKSIPLLTEENYHPSWEGIK